MTHLLLNLSIGPDTPVRIVRNDPFHPTVEDQHGNRAKVTWASLRPIGDS